MTEDDEATVKRFFKEKDYFRLQPENASMDPIIVDNVPFLEKSLVFTAIFINHNKQKSYFPSERE